MVQIDDEWREWIEAELARLDLDELEGLARLLCLVKDQPGERSGRRIGSVGRRWLALEILTGMVCPTWPPVRKTTLIWASRRATTRGRVGTPP